MLCLYVLMYRCLSRIGEELRVTLQELDFEDCEQHQLGEGKCRILGHVIYLFTFNHIYACMCINMSTLRIS
jgi:hypothetical protein